MSVKLRAVRFTAVRFRIPEMEGRAAHWYARQRGTESQLRGHREQADRLTAGLPAGAAILEVAPGPGYFAVELARRGFRVAGLDISHTMVEIAAEQARAAGVTVDFRQGDAAELPFLNESFDLVVCQAAFKNFPEPVAALDQMYRVLHRGGVAVIHDLRSDAGSADIAAEVSRMGIGPVNALFTRFALTALRRRAIPPAKFEELAASSRFGRCVIGKDGVGLEVRLRR
jgi:ubiquinone/menaquinone biosynthesis C-methylase UbiE